MTSTSRRSLSLALPAALLLVACGDAGVPPAGAPRQATAAAPLSGAACEFTAAHPKHAAAPCAACHACVGVVEFPPAGLASYPGRPPPAYDPVARTCTEVACHGVRPGVFSYSFQGGDGEPEPRTFSYGSPPRPTPSWRSTGLACDGCHDNPPRNGTWHSGRHAGQGPTGAVNQCQYCHPSASGANGVGTTITLPALHGNGAVEVQPRWTTRCFNCH